MIRYRVAAPVVAIRGLACLLLFAMVSYGEGAQNRAQYFLPATGEAVRGCRTN